QWSGASEFAPGTVIQAEGFAAVAPFRPVLRATRVKRLSLGEAPKPVSLDLTKEKIGHLQAELVTVDAEYLGKREAAPGQFVLHELSDAGRRLGRPRDLHRHRMSGYLHGEHEEIATVFRAHHNRR